MDRGSIRDALSGASVILGGIVTMYLVAMYSFSIAHLSELLRAINSIARTVPAPLFTGILIVGPVAFSIGTIAGGTAVFPGVSKAEVTVETRIVLLAGSAMWLTNIVVSLGRSVIGWWGVSSLLGFGNFPGYGPVFGVGLVVAGVAMSLPTPAPVTVVTTPIVTIVTGFVHGIQSVTNRQYSGSIRVIVAGVGTTVGGLGIYGLIDIRTTTYSGDAAGGFAIIFFVIYAMILFGYAALAFGIFTRGDPESALRTLKLQPAQRMLAVAGAFAGILGGSLSLLVTVTRSFVLFTALRWLWLLGSAALPLLAGGVGWFLADRIVEFVRDRTMSAGD